MNRWATITKYLNDNGITNYERFDAIDIVRSNEYDWPVPLAHKNRPNINYRAQLACKLSHWEVIRLAKSRGYNRILIFEDDLILKKNQVRKCNLAIKELIDKNLDWDLLWFFCLYHKLGERCGNYIWKLKYSTSMACYAVSSSCYDTVLSRIEKFTNLPIDDIYCNYIHAALRTYCINPNPFKVDMTVCSNITHNTIFHRIRTICINLERRPDRRDSMISKFNKNLPIDLNGNTSITGCNNINIIDKTRAHCIPKYEFYKAIDGTKLKATKELVHLFRNNDFNYRRGFIGCAMSHFNLLNQLLADNDYDYYMIYEDDIEFCENFGNLYATAITQIDQASNGDWDILVLGHHVLPHVRNQSLYSDYSQPLRYIKINKNATIGGMFSYLINKKGAHKLIKYIKEVGIRHGIDFIIMRMDLINIYETIPHIVTSNFVAHDNDGVDTDIQRTYDSLLSYPE